MYHDFGARNYDAQLGKWHAIDPLADKYMGASPYNYCLNNPIMLVDPDGRDIKETAERTEYTGADAVTAGKILQDKAAGRVSVLITRPIPISFDVKFDLETGFSITPNFSNAEYALDAVPFYALGTNIQVIQAQDANDAYLQMQTLKQGGNTIGNVIINSHGAYTSKGGDPSVKEKNIAKFSIGSDVYHASDVKADIGGHLKNINSLLSPDSQICLLSCYTAKENNGGYDLLKATSNAFGGKLVHGSKSWTTAIPGMFHGMFSPSGIDISENLPKRVYAYSNIGFWATAKGNRITGHGANSLFIDSNGNFSYRFSVALAAIRSGAQATMQLQGISNPKDK